MIVHATKQAAMDYLMNKGPSKPKAKSAAEPRETKPKTKQIGDGIFDFRVPKPARVGQKIQTLVPHYEDKLRMGRDGSGSAGKPTRPSTLEVMPLVLEAIWPRFEPGGICLQGQARIFKRCSSHERRERRVAPKLARFVQATGVRVNSFFQFTLACKSCGELIFAGEAKTLGQESNDSFGENL